MSSFNKPFNYDHTGGRWSLEMQKAPKDVFAQCGVKFTLDPGFPTGEKAPFYQTSEPAGLAGTVLEIRCFDNLSGWTSAVSFDFPTLIEKLIEIMPKDKVHCDSFLLAERDVDFVNKIKQEKEENEQK